MANNNFKKFIWEAVVVVVVVGPHLATIFAHEGLSRNLSACTHLPAVIIFRYRAKLLFI
jgi:hypothetical protein